jgi:hypothetical protein
MFRLRVVQRILLANYQTNRSCRNFHFQFVGRDCVLEKHWTMDHVVRRHSLGNCFLICCYQYVADYSMIKSNSDYRRHSNPAG